jgi:peptidoglycan/LPS O-acetylase OafA/YrhL
LRNALLVLRIDTPTRLVPPAWALTVELAFYIAIGLGVSRSARFTELWLAVGLAYTAYLVVGGASFSYRYSTFAAASLPFALGACVFHLKAAGRLPAAVWGHDGLLIGLLVALLVNFWLGEASGRHASGGLLHFYLNLVLSAGLIAHLAVRPARKEARRLDGSVGDLSYPIYLLHYQGGLLVLWVYPAGRRGDMDFLLLSTAVTLALAWAVNRFLEPAVQRMRDAIRASG